MVYLAGEQVVEHGKLSGMMLAIVVPAHGIFLDFQGIGAENLELLPGGGLRRQARSIGRDIVRIGMVGHQRRRGAGEVIGRQAQPIVLENGAPPDLHKRELGDQPAQRRPRRLAAGRRIGTRRATGFRGLFRLSGLDERPHQFGAATEFRPPRRLVRGGALHDLVNRLGQVGHGGQPPVKGRAGDLNPLRRPLVSGAHAAVLANAVVDAVALGHSA